MRMKGTVLSNKIDKDQLKAGDHIYSWRLNYLYTHHGIYSGDGEVIHFTRGEGQEYGTGTVLDPFIFSSSPSHSKDNPLGVFKKSRKPKTDRNQTDQSPIGWVFKGIHKLKPTENLPKPPKLTHRNRKVDFNTDKKSTKTDHEHPDNSCPRRCGDQLNGEGVISSCLECFLSGGDLYLFHYAVKWAFFLAEVRGGTCTLAHSDPPKDVLHRAKFLLHNDFGVYNISNNNCEDFAIYCKTGFLVPPNTSVGRSGQAASFLAAATAVGSSPLRFLTTSLPGLAAVGFGVYCANRFISDIGVCRDKIKVSVERFGSPLASEESEAVAEVANES